jgi:hypothetical protein
MPAPGWPFGATGDLRRHRAVVWLHSRVRAPLDLAQAKRGRPRRRPLPRRGGVFGAALEAEPAAGAKLAELAPLARRAAVLGHLGRDGEASAQGVGASHGRGAVVCGVLWEKREMAPQKGRGLQGGRGQSSSCKSPSSLAFLLASSVPSVAVVTPVYRFIRYSSCLTLSLSLSLSLSLLFLFFLFYLRTTRRFKRRLFWAVGGGTRECLGSATGRLGARTRRSAWPSVCTCPETATAICGRPGTPTPPRTLRAGNNRVDVLRRYGGSGGTCKWVCWVFTESLLGLVGG